MNISIIGIGYVGLPTALGLAKFGHKIICIDNNKEKIQALQNGDIPIKEEGIEELFDEVKVNITFTTDLSLTKFTDMIIITVGTPQDEFGYANLDYLYEVIKSIQITPNQIIAIKSTVPIGTNDKIYQLLKEKFAFDFTLISMPEFLREGFALTDFFNPDRIIIGTRDYMTKYIEVLLSKLYPIDYKDKIFITDIKSAELIKYASNAFLATKIHFINEIANFCEITGANIENVATGMGLDTRIGNKFLNAGIGYGGSCFPKDTLALNNIANDCGIEMKVLSATIEGNRARKQDFAKFILNKVANIKNPTIGILGLAFKEGTDDCRESASIDVLKYIYTQNPNITLKCHDKFAYVNAKNLLPFINPLELNKEDLRNCNIIILMNNEPEYKEILKNIDAPIIDTKRVLTKKHNILQIGIDKIMNI